MALSPEQEAARRRTFAIIAHPDAGKTTLTENLLLAGGAIRMAGAVKARGERRRTMSDWMKIERDRGISVSASVMTFEYQDCVFNLLDTPGHEDFSEDTYRTLTAADSAIMVLDAAKGIEPQTLKLFEGHPVGGGRAPALTGLDRSGLGPERAAVEQELLGERGLAGVRVRDDRKGAAWKVGLAHGGGPIRVHGTLLRLEG